jgi:NhaP-type Na+/H+ or K+/H+ antiporter
MYELLAVLALFTFVYSLVADRIEQTWISNAMVFCTFGMLAGPGGLNVIPPATNSEMIKNLAELTLALVLFTDAAEANLQVLRRNARLPLRLLVIGLPLTIGLGYLVGRLMFGQLGGLEIALLATMLAPTDAALGKPVISNSRVPVPYREGLNVESGLNDGICVPILMIFLELATGESEGDASMGMILSHFVSEIGIGASVGLGLTFAGVLLGREVQRRGWVGRSWSMLSIPALALGSFGLAQYLGGSGFIAAFAGGLLFDRLLGKEREPWLEEAESLGNLMSLVTWVTFGALVVDPALEILTWPAVFYGLFSLTVIRMLPVYGALIGTGMPFEAKLFIGWFGPRGLASVVFCVLVINANLPGESILTQVVAATIILSILLHGVSANLWAGGFGRRMQARQQSGAERQTS